MLMRLLRVACWARRNIRGKVMTLLELVYRLRLRLDDMGGDTGTVPAGYTWFFESDDKGCLWNNLELTSFLDSAQTELARRVPIRDNTFPTITLTPGKARYDIDPLILAIDSAVLGSTGLPLIKLSDAKDRNQNLEGDLTFADPTTVSQYRTDFDEYVLTVYATPLVADTLTLAVKRLPLEPFAWADRKTQEPEHPPQYMDALLDWATSLAYRKRDADTQNIDMAGFYQGQFTNAVGSRIDFQHSEKLKAVAGVRLRSRSQWY